MTEETKESTVEPGSTEAVQKARPLNQGQTNNLLKIVDGDFAKVRSMIRERTMTRQQEAEMEIRASIDANKREKFREKAQKLINKHNDELSKLKREGSENGWTVVTNGNLVSIKDTGIDAKIQKALQEIKTEENIALEVLNQKQADAERIVMLASISGVAEDVLATIPSVEALMLEAAREREEKRVRAIEMAKLREATN